MRWKLVVVVALAALCTSASSAQAYIYWGDSQNQTIGRANNDGSGVNDAFIHTGVLPVAIAVDSSHIYWANEHGSSIGRANIDGTNVNDKFIPVSGEPAGVAVNDTYIFWSNLNGGKIGRAKLNGSEQLPNLISAQSPCGVALDSGHVYWASVGTPSLIGRASFTGLNVVPNWVTMNAAGPCGLAVNSANIFWSDAGFFGPNGTNIGRANTSTGMGVDDSTIGGASGPCGVALDSSHLYWANAGTNTIGKANTDSTNVDQSFFATGGNQICGIAIDSLSPPPAPPGPAPNPVGPPAPPSHEFKVGPLKRNKAKGTGTLPITVYAAGALSLSGKGIRASARTAAGPSQILLTLKPKGKAKRRLERTGKLGIAVVVMFTPTGGTALAKERSLVLKRTLPDEA